MTKQEYLSAIRGKIRKMPADDINKFMDYYSEMIDDRMEDGLSEEDAVRNAPASSLRRIGYNVDSDIVTKGFMSLMI